MKLADVGCIQARVWVEGTRLSQNHSDVFSSLKKSQALSVGHVERFVKLHGQVYPSLQLRDLYSVAKPWG
jgi:hypothetical protein